MSSDVNGGVVTQGRQKL